MEVLSNSLRPFAGKVDGLQGRQTRYRQRYLDLVRTNNSRDVFSKRMCHPRETRRFLEERASWKWNAYSAKGSPAGAGRATVSDPTQSACTRSLFAHCAGHFISSACGRRVQQSF